MSTITVNGTQLYYELSGDSGVPMVLVHGSWGDHHNWDAVVPTLARTYRVLAYDRRGHSRSARPSSQGSLHEDAADLAALIEALGMAPAHVVGNSGGAAVSLTLAGERPELFRSLVVHEPPLFGVLADDPAFRTPLHAFGERVAAVVDLLRAGDHEGGARQFVETIAFGPGAWQTIPESNRRTLIANAPTFLDEMQDPEWASIDLTALRRYTRPALLSRGEQSPPLFPAVVVRLARSLPHASQHLFTGAGHVPHLTVPDRYVEVVTAFLSRVDAPADYAVGAPDRRPTPAT